MPDMTFESHSTARFLTSENNKLLCVISSFSNMLQNKWLYHNSICWICVFNPRWLLLHNGHCGCNGFMCADEGLQCRGAGKRGLYSTKLRLNSDTKWTSRERQREKMFSFRTRQFSDLYCFVWQRRGEDRWKWYIGALCDITKGCFPEMLSLISRELTVRIQARFR